jgi:hypothetical protein
VKPRLSTAAAAAAAVLVAFVAGEPTASATTAAHTGSPVGVTHDSVSRGGTLTGPVSCSTSNVWLRLWDSAGENCYSGNGYEVVNLPGASKEQIVGVHTVCLYASPSSARCATGPTTISIFAPAHVEQIFISTP